MNAATQYICRHQLTLWMLFVGSLVGLVFNVPAVLFLERNTGSHVIAWINMVGLVAFFLFSGGFLWRCGKW